MATFEKMLYLDVSKHIKKKQNQSYLSWTYAWSEFKKINPGANYEVVYTDNIPYIETPLGIMVRVKVTDGVTTHEMHLPVMNGAMKAYKSTQYSYYVKDFKTKKIVEKFVEPATMTDINKAIMRCLVKGIAMFGVGLYIYSGEDVPEPEKVDSQQLQAIMDAIKEHNLSLKMVCETWGIDKPANFFSGTYEPVMDWITAQ